MVLKNGRSHGIIQSLPLAHYFIKVIGRSKRCDQVTDTILHEIARINTW
jgi:hypothetical protein